jgi:hypothetical protein
MIKEINDILSQFRSCFSRESSFNWFVITVVGFIVRLDHHGVSSVIRWLNLDPGKYTSLLFFFRASSWNLKEIQQKWWQIVLNTCPIIAIKGRYLIVGDGIKVAKEAKKIPGVKRFFVSLFARSFMKEQSNFASFKENLRHRLTERVNLALPP